MSDFICSEVIKGSKSLSELFAEIVNDSNTIKSQFSWTQISLEQELEHAKALVVHFLNDGLKTPIGFLLYRELTESVEIMALATSPRFRGQGVQQCALNFLVSRAKENLQKIFLEVHAENSSAIGLYKKNKFSVIHIRRAYYADGADALVMQRLPN